mgnify:CR=1 FL=1
MAVYRVGSIGCGRIASLLEQEPHRGNPNTHAGCYDYCDRTQIVAAADANPQRREAFGQRWGVTGLYIDWQDMICLLYTSPRPRDATLSRMPSSA